MSSTGPGADDLEEAAPAADRSRLRLVTLAEDAANALAVVDPTARFVALTKVLDGIEQQRALLAGVRLEALGVLRDAGLSYDVIARSTGLHKQRIAQLSREWDRRSNAERPVRD